MKHWYIVQSHSSFENKVAQLIKEEAEKAEILTYSKQVDKLRNQAAEYSSEIEKFKATISTKDSEVTFFPNLTDFGVRSSISY